MTLKEIFDKADSENKAITYEQFESLMKESGAKFVDLTEDKYVSKDKYKSELKDKDKQIDTLNSTISDRDKDLEALQQQLKDAGTDADKLATISTDLTNLQQKYDNDVKSYQEQLAKQAYEFAVKEFAGTKKFSSNAAKRDFIQSMIAKELKMDADKILGAEDFVASYSADNEDAFMKEESAPEPEAKESSKPDNKPRFVDSTQAADSTGKSPAVFGFNFTGVRPKE